MNSVKQQHPTKVILVRVGEFYETWGFDAVMMVEHCGLNPMGFRLPRAGCPKMNIQRTLDDLTSKGLRCVVCEEAPMPYTYGARSKRKTRFVAQVVTPHSPVYVYNLSSNHSLSPEFSFQTPPVVGIAQRKQDAFTVMLMDVDLRQVTTYHDVNEEVAAHIISSNGFSPPVYCHESYTSSLDRMSKSSDGQKIHSIIQDSFKVKVRGDPFHLKFVDLVKEDLALGSDAQFSERDSNNTESKRPLPLYNMTAQSIGLTMLDSKVSNTPSLVSNLLPRDVSAPCKHFMARFLIYPPPASVSKSVQRSLDRISKVTVALPMLPILPSHKIAKMIHSREANHSVYVDLLAMLKGIQEILESQQLEHALFPLTEVAAMNTGRKFKTSEIQDVCEAVIQEIEQVINTSEYQEMMDFGLKLDEDDQCGDSEKDFDAASSPLESGRGGMVRSGDRAFESMMFANEKSVRVVLGACIEEELKRLELAREKLRSAIQDELEPAVGAFRNGEKVRISFDAINNSVSIRGAPKGAAWSKEWAKEFDLNHPRDRNGSRLSDRYSTERVEEALNEYRFQCHEMDLAVKHALKSLADRISPFIAQIVYLSHFALISKSFWLHATEALRKGWALPAIQVENSEGQEDRSLKLDGFWPFWMDGASPSTVKNSVNMDKMVLLTGPNMAGKSTVIRSMCAASLLANCGMYSPCDSTSQVPHFDAYILRSAESADSPEEGLSTFAVEMADAKAIVRDVTDMSLVFVDELCKGTEARAGGCLAAAMLEHLAKERKCLGLFATHLHDMLNLPAVTENTQELDFMAMETTNANDTGGGGGGESTTWRRQTTWKILPGVCTESLAYQVAEQYGVPSSIVQRAYDMDLASSQESGRGEEGNGSPVEAKASAAGLKAPTIAPAPNSQEEVAFDFDLAVSMLERQCKHALQGGKCQIIRLLPGQVPPPGSISSSCVYVLLDGSSGSYYIGETDNIIQRFAQHRQRFGQHLKEFAFCILPSNNKSFARVVETQTIRQFLDSGFPLLNILS